MDKHWVYKPMLDLIGKAEGTDPPRGRGYNETLAYGAYTGGPVDLVSMSLQTVDDLQSQMLRHPRNTWNSSAAGRYQIVRTTRRRIEEALGLSRTELFDEKMQDRMACYLLGMRGIDRWINRRMSDKNIFEALAREWASLPNWKGEGHYGGQRASVSRREVLDALEACRARYETGRPETEEQKEEHWFIRLLRVFFK